MSLNTRIYQGIPDKENNICRCCMAVKKKMTCAFSCKEPRTVEMLEFCTGVRISKSDGLPTKLCDLCVTKIGVAYKFKEDCLSTQKKLQKAFEKYEVKTEDIIKEEVEIDIQDAQNECLIKEEVSPKVETNWDSDENHNDFDNVLYISDVPYSDDDGDLDYKPNRPITKAPTKLKSTKNLIENIPKVTIGKEKLTKTTDKCTIDKEIVTNIKAKSTKRPSKYNKKKNKTDTQLSAQEIIELDLKKRQEKSRKAAEKYRYCDKCEIQFDTRKQIHEHKASVHGCEEICEVCGKQFVSRGHLSQHMKTHEEPEFQCHLCDYAASFRKDLEKHIRVHKGIKPYICEFCTKSFHNSSSLQYHRRTHLGDAKKQHVCPRCGFKFWTIDKLRRHLDCHDNIKRFACEYCTARYARREQWKKHLATDHNITIPRERPGKKKNVMITAIESTLQCSENTRGFSLKGIEMTNVSQNDDIMSTEVTS